MMIVIFCILGYAVGYAAGRVHEMAIRAKRKKEHQNYLRRCHSDKV